MVWHAHRFLGFWESVSNKLSFTRQSFPDLMASPYLNKTKTCILKQKWNEGGKEGEDGNKEGRGREGAEGARKDEIN